MHPGQKAIARIGRLAVLHQCKIQVIDQHPIVRHDSFAVGIVPQRLVGQRPVKPRLVGLTRPQTKTVACHFLKSADTLAYILIGSVVVQVAAPDPKFIVKLSWVYYCAGRGDTCRWAIVALCVPLRSAIQAEYSFRSSAR